jgi:HAE1 family hydrophobic/amphiphilic exporter-1
MPREPHPIRSHDSTVLPPGGGLVGVAIRQPVFTTMVMIGLMVVGFFSLTRLSTEEYPDVSLPILNIQTIYPGASPDAMEQQVTRIIEEAVNTSQGIEGLSSKSFEGVSVVTIQFVLGTDINAATAEVRSKIEQVRRQLPLDIDPPTVQQVDIREQPIISLGLSSESRSIGELTTLAEGDLRRELEGISGVGRVQLSGGVKREIQVLLHPIRLQSLDITANQAIGALRQQNLDAPAGRIEQASVESLVRVVGRVETPQDFGKIIVADRGGVPVRLSEIAEVRDGTEQARSLAMINGGKALGIDLMKVGGANTIDVATKAQKIISKLQTTLPRDVKLSMIRDSSISVRESVASVRDELISGAILTIIIVFVFLGSGRATIITSLALPVCVISTFIVFRMLGFTLNGMTMMALSLSIGLLVDDAIVVIESAVRHQQLGKNPFLAAFEGTQEIFLAVLASTLTIVAVFVPVAFMGGIVGKFFYQFGVTIAWAILVSLFVSFTLTPMLSAWWAGRNPHGASKPGRIPVLGRLFQAFDRSFDHLARKYRGVVSWVLMHRIFTLFLALLSFVGALALFPFIGGSFMPAQDSSEFMVTFSTRSGASFGYTCAKAAEIDSILRGLKEVELTYITVGAGAIGSINKGETYVKLVPAKKRARSQEELMTVVRSKLAGVYGVRTSVSEKAAVGAAQKPVQISLTGPQLETLGQIAQSIVELVNKVPGAIEVESSIGDPKPEIRLEVDVDQASQFQLDVSTILNTVQPLLAGQIATKRRDPLGREYNVVAQLPPEERTTAESLARLPIRRPGQAGENLDQQSVPLGQVATIRNAFGPSAIERDKMARVATISANVSGRSLSEVSGDIQAALAKMKLPPGYATRMGGDTEQLQQTVGYVVQAIALAIIMIYLILASQFGSFLQPLAIMFSVPLALIGVFLALLLTHDTLNMMSMIGLIMLMGIVTKNAILLLDSANEERRAGRNMNEALIHAGEVRFRPIMMTTAATIFGMLPIAFAMGAGGEARAPMARAVIGGLITSTLLTLLVVPVVYTYLEQSGAWFRQKFFHSPGDSNDRDSAI